MSVWVSYGKGMEYANEPGGGGACKCLNLGLLTLHCQGLDLML